MNYRDTLQQILEYIDAHIRDDLTADHLASFAGFSTYHFCRIFQWGVGYGPMTYVRSRRLAFAAHELSSSQKIIDIAMNYGFETHSGFSKAFRRQFGCTPETYRMHAHFAIPPLPSLATMKKYSIGGIIMEPKFVTRPNTTIIGYTFKTTSANGENFAAIPTFWVDYFSSGHATQLHSESFVKSHNEFGACLPVNSETGEFEYMIGVEPIEGASIPEGYEVREIPAATYAVFSTPPTNAENFSPTIQGTWQYIYSEWFPSSGYEFANGCADYELYDDRCMTENDRVCDIYIPITPKRS